MSDLQRVRASSLPELWDCPARWEAKHVLGMRMPTGGAAQLGTAVHAGTAIFDQSNLNGQMIPADDIAGVVVDTIWHPETDVDWGDSSPKEAEPIALGLFGKYCEQIAPRFDYIGIEAECEQLDITELGISLTGTTDRIYQDRMTGEYGIADLKTGKTAVSSDGVVKTAGHASQIAVYEILAEQATGLIISAPANIIGLTTAKTDKARRVGVGTIEGAKDLLLGDDMHQGLLEVAAGFIRSGLFYGNPRSSLCNPKYCPRYGQCHYRR